LSHIFAVTLPLSKALQREGIDMVQAISYAQTVIESLQNQRQSVEKESATVFAEAISIANKIGKSIEMSRLVLIQLNRQNTSASSPEEYYRRKVMIPVLDSILTDI
jgi:hypothetical protein